MPVMRNLKEKEFNDLTDYMLTLKQEVKMTINMKVKNSAELYTFVVLYFLCRCWSA